jgi:ubiquinone/menaquinone biosynthesis C-methylase UbiE
MELSPGLYRWLVRPKWLTKYYIHDVMKLYFDFENKTVLDFGSGVGSNCTLFHPRDYLGLDIDPNRVDYARRLNPSYRFQTLQGNRLPVSDRSKDLILIIAVLHHIPNAELHEYVKEFQRVLKPNGSILVIEPCFFQNCHISNWFMGRMDKGKHIQDEDGYFDLFRRHNFTIRVIKKFKKMFVYNELFFSAMKK